MNLFPQTSDWITDRLLPLGVLGVLVVFTVGWLGITPYIGFYYASTGELIEVYVQLDPDGLQVGDKIVSIDETSWEEYEGNLRQPLFKAIQPGESVEIVLNRNGKTITLSWTIPPRPLQEVYTRILNVWWFAYFFWLAGTATLLLVRPRDDRWKLMVAFNYLTALWLISGNMSISHLLASPLVMRVAIWMCMPVYLHLHWNLPQSLTRLPRGFWYGFYTLGIIAAVLQWFQWLPKSSYLFAFIVAIAGSVILLLLHYTFRREQRQDINILLIGTCLTLAPQIVPAIVELNSEFQTIFSFPLLALPLLPGAYFFTLYRRQLVGLELRANHLIASYVYLITLMMVFSLFVPISLQKFDFPGVRTSISLAAIFLATVITIMGYGHFCRLVERHLLSMPLASSDLLQSFTDRVATSLDTVSLVRLLTEEILPSLLIRQSALLDLSKEQQVNVVYYHGITTDQLPHKSQVSQLSTSSLITQNGIETKDGHTWVRLALPLRVGDDLVGLWLLGRRDPDNTYSTNDIATLRSLANQTAIALANIHQAEMLQMLYRANISTQETERGRLARDLHDVVLNQLAILTMKMDESTVESFQEDYQALTKYLRQTIQGLRPPTLNYGLRTALEAYCDDLSDRSNGETVIHFEIDPCNEYFESDVELHLFRIIQQAGENTMRHANAKNIYLSGNISPQLIELHLRDDGVGFDTQAGLDLLTLLAHEHFGLVSMYERARLINASLTLKSRPGEGTNVTVTWESCKTSSDD